MQSAPTPPSAGTFIERRPWLVYAAVICVALLLTLPALGELGLLSQAEIPAWRRARAANGAELDALLRTPALPNWLRARSFGWGEPEWALRLPSVIAHALGGALTLALARAMGMGWRNALLAPLFLWAFPVVGLTSRGAESPLLVECFVAGLLLAGLRANRSESHVGRASALALLILAGAAATASGGIAWGAALPLTALAMVGGGTRGLRVAYALGAVACGLVALSLALDQGEGYIPLLGAAPDPYLIDQPQRRDLVAGVEEFGYHIFPFTILVLLGTLVPARRQEEESGTASSPLAAIWLALGVGLAVAWSAKYGRQTFPITIPAALCAAKSLSLIFEADYDARLRRFALVMAICGLWVAGKDGERTPSRIASPQHRFTNEKRFPDEQVQAAEHFEGWVRWAWLALLIAYATSPRSRESPRPGRLGDLPALDPHWREKLPWALMALALAHQSVSASRSLAVSTASQLSVRSVYDRHRAWVASGQLPTEVGTQRIRDPGLELYGPEEGTTILLPTRQKLLDYLKEDTPRAAFIRIGDYPGIFQKARERKWPLHVLDWSHHDIKLVANHLPEGIEAIRPLEDVVYDENPGLEHETFVRFEDKLELIGWQMDGEVKRGSTVTVSLAFRVLRAMPGNTKIYVRLQRDRISKVNVFPHEPAQGMYPGNHWRKGDYIVDRYELEIPSVNTLPGVHDFFVGVAKGDKAKLEITVPEGRSGDFGVTLRGSKSRNMANLAKIDLR